MQFEVEVYAYWLDLGLSGVTLVTFSGKTGPKRERKPISFRLRRSAYSSFSFVLATYPSSIPVRIFTSLSLKISIGETLCSWLRVYSASVN